MTAVVETISALRQQLDGKRNVGLVPTMGALHQGHATLIAAARAECDIIVVSIFVNPLQFDRKDDLERYPRTPDTDRQLCERLGVDFIVSPSAREMYPTAPLAAVNVERVGDHLCGKHRPGHFRGVATVVMKLLQIVRPARAYFGEKDAQQLAVIRKMVIDLNVPVTIVPVATVREPDGLAISSRNRHLGPQERQSAPALYAALRAAERMILDGETSVEAVTKAAAAVMGAVPGIRIEYFEIVDPDDMQPMERIAMPALVAGAIWIGSTRLIDNVVVNVTKDMDHEDTKATKKT
jgi:pantoate--beta-alanine ligase